MTFGGRLKKKCLCNDPQVVKSGRRIFVKAKLKKSGCWRISSLTQDLLILIHLNLVNAVNWV